MEDLTSVQMINRVLAREKPKLVDFDDCDYYCPSCGTKLNGPYDDSFKYCPWCGQKIKWPEDDEDYGLYNN